jgi:hypothetical protein
MTIRIMKAHTTTPANHRAAYDKPLSPADYEQGCYGIALFFLTILIPVILGVSLCSLFTSKRSR